MKTKLTKSTTQSSLVFAILLGISSGVHALCVNADGSLDDGSMETALIQRDLLPICEAQPVVPALKAQSSAPTVPAGNAESEPVKTVREPARPLKVKSAKSPDQNSSLIGDCRTASGESRDGSLGVAELLPSCDA